MSNLDFYLVDRPRRRLLGHIPKAGSSSIKAWLLEQHGIPFDPADPHRDFPDKQFTLSRQPDQEVLYANWPAYLVVRHPLDRLLSCWRNKFLDGRNTAFNHLATSLKIRTFADWVRWLEQRPDLDKENPHWRPQPWFRLSRTQLVPLSRISTLCPGIGWINGSRRIAPPEESVRQRVLALYADGVRLFEEAVKGSCAC